MQVTDKKDELALFGGRPVFVQTAEKVKEDRWQQMTEEEARLAYEMTLRNEISGGTPTVRQVEEDFAKLCNTKYCMSVCNGSSALYCAYFGVGLGPGDEIICPTYTWICTAGPALLLGARPVFCEIDPTTLLADPADIRKRITPRTKAIVVVHLWGWVCDMDPIMAIGREFGIPVIEDCSHAHGAKYKGRPVGCIGDIGAFSLQGSKPVSAGEGGMVVGNNAEYFERAVLVSQVNRMGGLDLVTERYVDYQPLGLGMKFRSHPLAIGIAGIQLKRLAKLNEGRRRWVETIEAGIAGIPGLTPVRRYDGAEPAGFYGFPMLHHPEQMGGLSTERFVEALKAEGVRASRSGYGLLHRLLLFEKGFDIFTRNRGPLCGDYRGYKQGDLPVSEEVHQRIVFLPCFADPLEGLAEQHLEAVCKVSKACDRLAAAAS
jgi:dTDP-4-amino-4,6-dideoxygalactose transaminase